jgi:hypothetical protein
MASQSAAGFAQPGLFDALANKLGSQGFPPVALSPSSRCHFGSRAWRQQFPSSPVPILYNCFQAAL